jgi:iron complex transport system substrate-binding protein
MSMATMTLDRPFTDEEILRILDDITRREFIVGSAGVGALLVGCTAPAEDTGSSAGPWSFTDDRGIEVSLPSAPTRFVAFSTAAAALAEFGLTPAGIFGWSPPEGDDQLRYVDLAGVATLGTVWAEFNVEAMVAVAPELIVAMYDPSDDSLWDFKNRKQEEQIGEIAPLVGIDVLAPLLDQLARWRELASSLGADVQGSGVEASRSRFESSTEALRTAAAAKPGLKVMAVAPQPDAINVVDPGTQADLTYYESLGVEFVVPDEGEFPGVDTLSYENLDRYRADVILVDAREAAEGFADQLEAVPTWQLLPAVQAGQVGGWHIADPPAYRFYIEAIEELTPLIERAQIVT